MARKKKEEKNNIEKMAEEVLQQKINERESKGMTYTELVSQEFNEKVGKVKEEEKYIVKSIKEVLEDIKENGHATEKTEFITKLREKEIEKGEEIKAVSRKYEVDIELKTIAGKLDRANQENKGIDLIFSIGPKINEIIDTLGEIEKCYGGNYYSPACVGMLKMNMNNVAAMMNNELVKLKKADKEELKRNLEKRMFIIEKKKIETQMQKERYNLATSV